jgi:hypothetical protein
VGNRNIGGRELADDRNFETDAGPGGAKTSNRLSKSGIAFPAFRSQDNSEDKLITPLKTK